MVMAQTPESAKHDAMLAQRDRHRAWWTTCCPPEQMPAQLVEYARLPA